MKRTNLLRHKTTADPGDLPPKRRVGVTELVGVIRIARLRPLFASAWRYRHNITLLRLGVQP